jgi:hypothetical protein
MFFCTALILEAAYLRLQSILIGSGKHAVYTLLIQSMDGRWGAVGKSQVGLKELKKFMVSYSKLGALSPNLRMGIKKSNYLRYDFFELL